MQWLPVRSLLNGQLNAALCVDLGGAKGLRGRVRKNVNRMVKYRVREGDCQGENFRFMKVFSGEGNLPSIQDGQNEYF